MDNRRRARPRRVPAAPVARSHGRVKQEAKSEDPTAGMSDQQLEAYLFGLGIEDPCAIPF